MAEHLPAEAFQTPHPDDDWALVLGGPGLRSLGHQHISEIQRVAEEMAGGERILVAVVRGITAVRLFEPKTHPEPVPATKSEFRGFAIGNGYSDRMGFTAWNSVCFTYGKYRHGDWRDCLPIPRYLDNHGISINRRDRDPFGRDVLDLRSVHERLTASGHRPDAWIKGTTRSVDFLRHLCKVKILEADKLPETM